jgi:hypothetical protein
LPQQLLKWKGELRARNDQWILPTLRFHDIVGNFYMPQSCDMGPTALLPLRRKTRWGVLRPEKSDGRVRTRELGYQRPAR